MNKVIMQMEVEMHDCEQCPKCKIWHVVGKKHECVKMIEEEVK